MTPTPIPASESTDAQLCVHCGRPGCATRNPRQCHTCYNRVTGRYRAYYAANVERAKANTKASMLRYPEKVRARRVAYNALRRGDLQQQPCQKCGTAKSEMHHPDHAQPLQVEWLCRPCHAVKRRLVRLSDRQGQCVHCSRTLRLMTSTPKQCGPCYARITGRSLYARKDPEKARAYRRATWRRYKVQKNAQAAVYRALRKGLLQRQPCKVCAVAGAHAHHTDYSKPLEVEWLCRKHHGETWRKYA